MLNFKYEGFLFASVWLATLCVCTEFAKKLVTQEYAYSQIFSKFWQALTWQITIKTVGLLFRFFSWEDAFKNSFSRVAPWWNNKTTHLYKLCGIARRITSGLAFRSQQKFLTNCFSLPWINALTTCSQWWTAFVLHSLTKLSASKPTNYWADIQRHTLDDKHGSDCFQGALIPQQPKYLLHGYSDCKTDTRRDRCRQLVMYVIFTRTKVDRFPRPLYDYKLIIPD